MTIKVFLMDDAPGDPEAIADYTAATPPPPPATKPRLSIACNGQVRLMILSADEHECLKRRGRWALAVGGLPVAEFDAVRHVEPPAEVAGYDHDPKCPDQRFPSLMGSRT